MKNYGWSYFQKKVERFSKSFGWKRYHCDICGGTGKVMVQSAQGEYNQDVCECKLK